MSAARPRRAASSIGCGPVGVARKRPIRLLAAAGESRASPRLTVRVLKLRPVRGPWLVFAAGPLLVIAVEGMLVVSGGNLHDPAMQAKALAHVDLLISAGVIEGFSDRWVRPGVSNDSRSFKIDRHGRRFGNGRCIAGPKAMSQGGQEARI